MVGVTGRTGKNAKAVREFKAAGNKAMQAGSFQKAMRLYTKALELDAGNPILYSNRSAAHFNTRQFSESLEDAESAILCDAMWWKAYKRKGLALIHMQRYEEAIGALDEGLKIIGKNAEMEKNLEFAKACQEQAQNLYILPEPHMMQRLESVPVFIVTDNVGQPFFVTYDDGQQVCTFYFDQDDANSTLEWIKSENPGLGDTARVIHITLHQAFNLAQETQKQYYEETTRAAAEEDRAAAEAEATSKAGNTRVSMTATDVDGDEKDDEDGEAEVSKEEISTPAAQSTTASDTRVMASGERKVDDKVDVEGDRSDNAGGDGKSSSEAVDGADSKEDATAGNKNDSEAGNRGNADSRAKAGDESDTGDNVGASGGGGNEQGNDDAIVDENAPLSFQFRPELRQVKVAVELLNKNPDPPVKPILRDPPSVRKAKAEAAAAAAMTSPADEDGSRGKVESGKGNTDGADNGIALAGGENGQRESAESMPREVTQTAIAKAEDTVQEANVERDADSKEVGVGSQEGATTQASLTDSRGASDNAEAADNQVAGLGDEDVELTVDNFNGIPIFQAKGLTLLQKNKQLIPLFFSKWDLEDAWKQLKESNAMDVPGQCDIEVGTLEDVLRRMSESKTDEFQSVFFVPSREAMKAINVKFPLDDLASSSPVGNKAGAGGKPMVKKAGFSRAKQIAARGGTKDEIRAAIREDLEKHRERQKMAEIIAQIEQAGRTGSVNGLGRVTGASSSSSNLGGTSAKSSKAAKAGKAGTVA